MTRTADPLALKRRLRAELRRLRDTAGMTQKDVADRLDWSPSKIIRIEKGAVTVGVTDLRALLDTYGVSDTERVQSLVEMARGSRKPTPMTHFRGAINEQTLEFFSLETASAAERSFELMNVPGLLQTDDYTRALLKGLGAAGDHLERIAASRQEHQTLLERTDPSPPELHFVIDEAVIRRVVGGLGVMKRQLEHLAELARQPRITVQVIPFPVGAHPGMLGPFVHLEFPEPEDDDVVYLELSDGAQVFKDNPETTTPYLERFRLLSEIACAPSELDDYLDRAITRLPKEAQS